MKTVALLNKKGGVGKTSTCHHLGGELAARGLRVLLVDADPQASLTQGLLAPDVARALPPETTIAALFDDQGCASADHLIIATPFANISILPGSEVMEDLNVTRPSETGALQYALRDSLSDVAARFDICLIDCPPGVQLCSWSALIAADGVVVPLQAEDYGSQGLVAIRKSIRKIQAGPNPSLAEIGYLVTMFHKTLAVHVAYESDLRELYGPLVFDAVVPLAKDFKEAVMKRLPIRNYKPRSAASKAVATLADEFLSRLETSIAERRVA